ncbi:hypothetical protein AURDEDRAFT_159808 [Auricularia subglabra TFB-10046 SS5]|nr:hypothetical protein AURDEDRAFT_159808 [Auricularia subglabra TFB-10046 SS5]
MSNLIPVCAAVTAACSMPKLYAVPIHQGGAAVVATILTAAGFKRLAESNMWHLDDAHTMQGPVLCPCSVIYTTTHKVAIATHPPMRMVCPRSLASHNGWGNMRRGVMHVHPGTEKPHIVDAGQHPQALAGSPTRRTVLDVEGKGNALGGDGNFISAYKWRIGDSDPALKNNGKRMHKGKPDPSTESGYESEDDEIPGLIAVLSSSEDDE